MRHKPPNKASESVRDKMISLRKELRSAEKQVSIIQAEIRILQKHCPHETIKRVSESLDSGYLQVNRCTVCGADCGDRCYVFKMGG